MTLRERAEKFCWEKIAYQGLEYSFAQGSSLKEDFERAYIAGFREAIRLVLEPDAGPEALTRNDIRALAEGDSHE